MADPTNSKVFSLKNKISSTFSLSISQFAYAATFLFRIRDRIRLVFSASLVLGALSNIHLRRVRILTQVKLLAYAVQQIRLRRVRLTILPKEILKGVSNILFRHSMVVVLSSRVRAISNILLRRVRLSISPVIAQFFTLGDYDPSTLEDLDDLTLGEMDYVET
jgi:hypothetical protein